MSGRRFLTVFRLEFVGSLKRPLIWVFFAILALFAWGLSTGGVRIQSGSSDVGGAKAFMTSQFAMAQLLALLTFLLYSFFVAVAAGMSIVRDEEENVGAILHATPLTVREYVWGKFLGVLACFLVILVMQLGLHIGAQYFLSGAKEAEFVGPFSLANYLIPAAIFALPLILFMAGASFALGAMTLRPILVFAFPVAFFLFTIFFLWSFTPSWLSVRIDHWLMWIDPSGFRWLQGTQLKVDRGVAFYNTQSIPIDWPFALSRIAFALIGLIGVALSAWRYEYVLRGRKRVAAGAQLGSSAESVQRRTVPLASLSMRAEPPGFWSGSRSIARTEMRALRSQAGLYLFVPLILLQMITVGLNRTGAFDTPLLSTSGVLASASMNTLTLCIVLLLLFYTVESLERERATSMAQIHGATSVKTASILFGKALANSFVGVVVLLAAFVANMIILLVEGKAPLELRPFLLVWGLCLVPTLILWSSYIAAVHSIVRGRFTAYGVGLVTVMFTGWLQTKNYMSWVGNWDLWSSIQWSDMSVLELDRRALVLNRLLALSLAAFFTALAVRFYPRRALDAVSLGNRLRPKNLALGALRLAPLALPPFILGCVLFHDVRVGFRGDDVKKKAKDYWTKNVNTWKDVPTPAITGVELDLDLEPAQRSFHARGTAKLLNEEKTEMRQLALTTGFHFTNVKYTLDGEEAKFVDRAGLHVLTPPKPLAPGETLALGFEHDGVFPKGISKNGGSTMEFILDGGVVLTSFGPQMVPMLGFIDGRGVDEDNRTEAKEYADDFYEGITKPELGNGTPYPTRITIHIPADFTANSVGQIESETIENGRRTVVWKSDHPVQFFNIVAGKWRVKKGYGTAIYYHPAHEYNIDEMLQALDGARKHYSEWFAPFPWKELKLSEFPALSGYAQGFPTDITFSEGIGFLTKSDPRARVAFMVTAHESAHQWWGNMLVPGKGPGGNILSEGMSHFSTILLMDAELGLRDRIEFCKQIESRYGDNRQVDDERPLVKVDGSRNGDTTCTYDKGGWVFWMLLNHIGRDNDLRGLQEFMRKYETNPDHPVLQDFVATMRPFAPNAESYDAFTKQWFFEVKVPEYELSDAKKTKQDDGSWLVHVTVKNKGTGTMPLEVAAARGERFPDADKKKSTGEDDDSAVQAAESKKAADTPYADARVTLELGAGESKTAEIRCTFEPSDVLVDPDALVLQLNRKLATKKL